MHKPIARLMVGALLVAFIAVGCSGGVAATPTQGETHAPTSAPTASASAELFRP